MSRLEVLRTRRAALAIVLLAVGISHMLLATVYVPVHSDINTYRGYAAAVAKALGDGTSFSVARDARILDGLGSEPPAEGALLVEYPPLAVIWMAATAIGIDFDAASGQPSQDFAAQFRLAMLVVDAVVVVVLVTWASRTFLSASQLARTRPWHLAIFGLAGVILGNLMFDRLDLIVAALLLASATLLARGSWLPAFVLLALAINFKASPLALAPLWVLASLPLHLFTEMRSRQIAFVRAVAWRSIALAGVSLIVFLPFLLIEGARAIDFLRFRALQGVHIESIPGSLLLILQRFGLPLEVRLAFGTFELQTVLSPALAALSPLVLVFAVAALVVLYVRAGTRRLERPDPGPDTRVGDRTDPHASLASSDPSLFLIATVAALLLTLVTSKLLSPQYLIWVLPFVALIDLEAARTRTFQFWFLVTCAVSTVIFPYLLGRTLARLDPAGEGYLEPTLLGVGLVVARNVLLIGLAWLLVSELRHSNRTPSRSMAASEAVVP